MIHELAAKLYDIKSMHDIFLRAKFNFTLLGIEYLYKKGHLMEQNLNHYKIFYEVAKCGNISKAAEKLYISQPAVSKSISKLEQSLSHTLFIRSKRGVRLTDEGATLYECLDKAFDTIDHAEKKLRQISELGMGQLRIGASTSLCKHILLPYLQAHIANHKRILLRYKFLPVFT